MIYHHLSNKNDKKKGGESVVLFLVWGSDEVKANDSVSELQLFGGFAKPRRGGGWFKRLADENRVIKEDNLFIIVTKTTWLNRNKKHSTNQYRSESNVDSATSCTLDFLFVYSIFPSSHPCICSSSTALRFTKIFYQISGLEYPYSLMFQQLTTAPTSVKRRPMLLGPMLHNIQ